MPIAFPLFWSITITLHNWIWCYLMNKSSRSSWIYILCYSEISILEWVNLITLTLTSFVKKNKTKNQIWKHMTHIELLHYCFKILVFLDRYVSVELQWCMMHATAYLSVSFHMKNYYTNSTIIRMTMCQFKHQGNNFVTDFEIVRCISL